MNNSNNVIKQLHKNIDFENDVLVDNHEFLIIVIDNNVIGKMSKIRFFLGTNAHNLNYILFFKKLDNGFGGVELIKTEVIYHESMLLISTSNFLKQRKIEINFRKELNDLRFKQLCDYYRENFKDMEFFPIFKETFGVCIDINT